MAGKPYVTLYLADGSKERLELDEDNPTASFYQFLNREGEYATGWVTIRSYQVNLAAVVKLQAFGDF